MDLYLVVTYAWLDHVDAKACFIWSSQLCNNYIITHV